MRRLVALVALALTACESQVQCSTDAECRAPERCVRFSYSGREAGRACFQLCGDAPRSCASGFTCVACREAPNSCTLDDGADSGPFCAPP